MRALYRGLFVPTVTYAAAAWADPLNRTSVQALRAIQRHALLLVTKAYRNVSADALPVIAGVLPIEVKIKEAVLRYKVRRNIPFELPGYSFPADIDKSSVHEVIGDFTEREWQCEWDNSTKGRHTYVFFPDVYARTAASWLYLTHEVVQFLSGHEDFNKKLHEFGFVKSENCACGTLETVQHVIYDCKRHDREREQLRESLEKESIPWPITERELVSRKAYGPFAS